MFWLPVGLSILLFAIYRSVKQLQKYLKWRTLQAIPGPKCSFWMGQFTAIRKEPFMAPHKRWLQDMADEDAPLVRYNSLLGRNQLMILDPMLVKEILTAPAGKDDCRFYRSLFILPSIIGKGVLTLEGEEWLKHRRLIQPAFAAPFLKQALDASVAPKTEVFVKLWKKAGPRQEIDVATHLAALTLDIMGDVGFSHDCNGISDMERWAEQVASGDNGAMASAELSDPLITSVTDFLKPNVLRIFLFLSGFGWLDSLINPSTRRLVAALNDSIEGIIDNARHLEDSTKGTDGPSQNKRTRSLLQVLMQAKDGESSPFTDRELRDELKTFLLAGHETTSTWCYWAIFAMSKYPDAQAKLFEDVMKEAPVTDAISLEHVEKMEYLNAFLQECLRLYPPVGMILRLNRHEERFAGYTVPSETHLVIPIHLLHRHPKYWGPDAEAFRPERWLGNNNGSAGGGIDTKGFTFLPFSSGAHNCIGYRFATMEAKLIMAHMVRALRIEIAPSQRDVEHTFTTNITMKTKPALKVVVKPR